MNPLRNLQRFPPLNTPRLSPTDLTHEHLLPCPWCGATYTPDDGLSSLAFVCHGTYVICHSCGCQGPHVQEWEAVGDKNGTLRHRACFPNQASVVSEAVWLWNQAPRVRGKNHYG